MADYRDSWNSLQAELINSSHEGESELVRDIIKIKGIVSSSNHQKTLAFLTLALALFTGALFVGNLSMIRSTSDQVEVIKAQTEFVQNQVEAIKLQTKVVQEQVKAIEKVGGMLQGIYMQLGELKEEPKNRISPQRKRIQN